MDVNFQPVTNEIEKLRTFLAGVAEQLLKNDNKQRDNSELLTQLKSLVANETGPEL